MPTKINTEIFIKRAKKIHGDKYDYSSVQYVHSTEKVKIFCKSCNEYWMQKPKFHLRGNNCKRCTDKQNGVDSRRFTNFEQFIKKANKIHNNKFIYLSTDYVALFSRIKVQCKNCNNIFEQRASDHLTSKYACKLCSHSARRLSVSTFIDRAKSIHGNKFDYSNVNYKNNFTKIKIYCIEGKHFFEQTPTNHISRRAGCFKCLKNKFNKK